MLLSYSSKHTIPAITLATTLSILLEVLPCYSNPFFSNIFSAQIKKDTPISLVSNSMSQVNYVSQLRDISPGDWSFESLKNLAENYRCIVSYPDKTFLDNKAMTRYEFASALNSCLNSLEQLTQDNGTILKEDLNTLKRLQQDFKAELALISTPIENLESRVSSLDNHQFSTTLKMRGIVSINLLDTFSGGGNANQAVLQQLTYLGFSASFTGRDLLYLSFNDSNTNIPNYVSVNGGRDYGITGSTREGLTNWAYGGSTNNILYLLSLEYIFPVLDTKSDRLLVTLAANNGFNTSQYLLPTKGLSWQGSDLGNGAISAFGQRNPMYRLGGGQGGLINYDNDHWEITIGYLADQGNSPQPGRGLLNGDYLAVSQINYSPNENFTMALAYNNNYFGPGQFAFNNQYKYGPNSPGYVGTGLANTFANKGVFFNQDVAVVSNTYGFQAFYQVNNKFVIGGFGAKIRAILLGHGDAEIWTYSLNLAFPDLGKEGNMGGIIVGVEPTLTGLIVGGQYIGGFKNDTGLHIEGFYRYSFNDRLSITPGLIWITSPNQDSSNSSIVVGVLRTTFSF
jgi:Carbohydrate-selective porin, OprB family